MVTQTVPFEHEQSAKPTFWQRLRVWGGSDAVTGYAFVFPAFAWIALLVAMPFLVALAYSVSNAWIDTEWSWAEFLGLQEGELAFLGLKNFIALFHNRIFLQTLQNSVVFSTISVALKAIFGLTLALLLNRTLRFNKAIRGALLLPFVVPTALSTLAWWWMFDSLYSVVNWTLVHLGLSHKGLPWLSNPYLAMLAIIIVNTWRGLPFFAITVLAGLVSIPNELYEAAETDGAGPLARFWHITLPLLRPVLAVVVLFSTIFTLAEFNIVFVLTRGGPENMTHLFATLTYTTGLIGGKLSQGAAISLFLFPFMLAVVYFQLKLIRRDTTYD
jgi:multiple sugar transport system permease protein